MNKKSMRGLRLFFLVFAIVPAGLHALNAHAQTTHALKKPRHVTNRYLPPVTEPEFEQVQDEEDFVVEPLADYDSPVIQASCKNCKSTAVSMQPIESGFDIREIQDDAGNELDMQSAPVYEASSPHYDGGSIGSEFDGNTCCDSYFDGCKTCGINPCSPFGLLANRLFIRAESGTFWGTGQRLPTLVTSNGRSLFGGGETGMDSVSGFRSETGLWLDNCQSRAVVVRTFYGGDNDINLSTNSSLIGNLELPFLSVANGATTPSQAFIAIPNQLSGSVNANLSSNVYGGDILFKRMIARDNLGRWDWLMGYKTARLAESLTIDSTRSTIPPGTTNQVRDSFRVKNQFHGATFGFSGDVREGCWYFGGMFQLGIGNMQRAVDIQGNQTTTVANVPSSTNSGLHASSRTNAGSYNFDRFVVTPELNLTAGYRLTRRLDFTIGYNLLRLPKVTRVANALDPRLAVDDGANPTQLNPSFVFRESNFTLHSLNLGLQWNF